MFVVVIDNYDSFTYNLVQRLGEIDPTIRVEVYRNDQLTCEQIDALHPDRVIVSPGPCTPNEAGSASRPLSTLAQRSRCSAFAWVINRSVKLSAERSFARRN